MMAPGFIKLSIFIFSFLNFPPPARLNFLLKPGPCGLAKPAAEGPTAVRRRRDGKRSLQLHSPSGRSTRRGLRSWISFCLFFLKRGDWRAKPDLPKGELGPKAREPKAPVLAKPFLKGVFKKKILSK